MSALFFIINTNELRYYGSPLSFVFGECCSGYNFPLTKPSQCWWPTAENPKTQITWSATLNPMWSPLIYRSIHLADIILDSYTRKRSCSCRGNIILTEPCKGLKLNFPSQNINFNLIWRPNDDAAEPRKAPGALTHRIHIQWRGHFPLGTFVDQWVPASR